MESLLYFFPKSFFSSQDSQIATLNLVINSTTFYRRLATDYLNQMLELLIDFLQTELQVSADAISLAQRTRNLEPNILPIVLWQYGLLDTKQLDRVLDWLEVS